MSGRSRRRKILGGALGASIVWLTVDMVTRGPGPTTVEASPAVVDAAAEDPPVTVAQRAQRVLDRLQAQSDLAAARGPDVHRDLFALVAQAWETRQALEPLLARKSDEPEPEAVVQELPFVDRHTLKGVVEGPETLALIDDVIVAEGGVVDGYKVVAIGRDRVCLRGPDETVTLVITGPYVSPPPAPIPNENDADKDQTEINSLGGLVDYLNGTRN